MWRRCFGLLALAGLACSFDDSGILTGGATLMDARTPPVDAEFGPMSSDDATPSEVDAIVDASVTAADAPSCGSATQACCQPRMDCASGFECVFGSCQPCGQPGQSCCDPGATCVSGACFLGSCPL